VPGKGHTNSCVLLPYCEVCHGVRVFESLLWLLCCCLSAVVGCCGHLVMVLIVLASWPVTCTACLRDTCTALVLFWTLALLSYTICVLNNLFVRAGCVSSVT
jgi:hypothetical protein